MRKADAWNHNKKWYISQQGINFNFLKPDTVLKVLFTGTRYIIQVNNNLEYSHPREKNVLSGIIFLVKVRSMFRLIKTYWKVLLYSTVCQQLWDCQFCCYVSLLLRKQKYHKSEKCSLNLEKMKKFLFSYFFLVPQRDETFLRHNKKAWK